MRRRLAITIIAMVVGTLLVVSVAGYLLVQRTAVSTSQTELTSDALTLGTGLSNRTARFDTDALDLIRRGGSYDTVQVVGLSAGGTFSSLPGPVTPQLVDVAALQGGSAVAGHVGGVVYAAVPLSLALRERLALALPLDDVPVLVVTRDVSNPVSGLGWLLLIAAAAVVVAAVVAALIARRISAPLELAVGATGRIADGELDAKVPVARHDYPELRELARSINQMSDSLTRARGMERQFLLSVSHELRTPLTSIRGYAEAVADGATDDVPGAVAVITAEAQRLERLVQDLLDLARLDARQFSLAPERVDVSTVAGAVSDGFRPEAVALGIDLSTSLPDGEGLWVDADPDRIGQVAANLVENAFKFARRRVAVGASRYGDDVALWVVDDGSGIDAADLPRIFERHFTSDRVPTRRLGSGLGLAIVDELVGAMGGRVWAESPVDGSTGTRVVVTLPAKAAPDTVPDGAPGGVPGAPPVSR